MRVKVEVGVRLMDLRGRGRGFVGRLLLQGRTRPLLVPSLMALLLSTGSDST